MDGGDGENEKYMMFSSVDLVFSNARSAGLTRSECVVRV